MRCERPPKMHRRCVRFIMKENEWMQLNERQRSRRLISAASGDGLAVDRRCA